MLRRIAVTALILSLLGLTVASVSALWKQQSPEIKETSDSSPLVQPVKAGNWIDWLDSRQQDLLGRLDQRLEENTNDYEASLLKSLLLFQAGQLDLSLGELQRLVKKAPKFQLAHLVLGDLLLARFDQVRQIGENPLLEKIDAGQVNRIEQLRKEARARLQGYMALTSDIRIPRALIALSEKIEYALVVDKSKNRLFIYKNAGTALPPQLVDDFYIVLGRREGNKFSRGDLKTPSGVYFVTSYIPDEKLPPKYGTGAFPVNYPNEFDSRLKKTGDGIWLHGTDKSLYSRPPLDSEGCVVLTNDEFSRIGKYVDPGLTPVVISEQVEWISAPEWLDSNIELQATLENWRHNWESADIQAYLDSYSPQFWAKGYTFESWQDYKSRVLSGKSFQKIILSDISLLGYPVQSSMGKDVVVANLHQKYRSNNYNGDVLKRLYLVNEEGRWRVLYEGRQ